MIPLENANTEIPGLVLADEPGIGVVLTHPTGDVVEIILYHAPVGIRAIQSFAKKQLTPLDRNVKNKTSVRVAVGNLVKL